MIMFSLSNQFGLRFFWTPCRDAATLGMQRIDNMISEYQQKKSNETILICGPPQYTSIQAATGYESICAATSVEAFRVTHAWVS